MTVLYDDILSGAYSRAIFATNQNTLTTSNVLAFLDNIVRLEITSQIDRTAQEFFVNKLLIPMENSKTFYQIPYRAMGRQLREVQWYDSTQNQYRHMPMLKLEDATSYQNFGANSFYGYYLSGDQIVMVPEVSDNVPAGYNLAVWIKLIPSKPCLSTDSAQVTGIDPLTGIVTVNSVPTNILVGGLIDFIRGHAGCSVFVPYDIPVVDCDATTITFDPLTLPADLAIGDYISVAQTSPVLNMIPEEASGLIQNKLAQLILKSLGDEVGANAIQSDINIQQDSLLRMVSPRVNGEPQIIINRNNLTRGGRNWQNWSYGRVSG